MKTVETATDVWVASPTVSPAAVPSLASMPSQSPKLDSMSESHMRRKSGWSRSRARTSWSGAAAAVTTSG